MSEFINEVTEQEEFRAQHERKGLFFKNLKTHEVIKRPQRNNAGMWFNIADYKCMEAHISELAPGGHSNRHRHKNEAIIYIVTGRGYSIIQREGEEPQRFDWEEGDMFAPPYNAWHQHFNADPEQTARYLAITNVGLMMKLGLFTKESAKAHDHG